MSQKKTVKHKAPKNILTASIKKIANNPSVILKASAWKKFARKISKGSVADWEEDRSHKGIKTRLYSDYNEYLEHQKSKIDKKGEKYLQDYDRKFHDSLLKRLQSLNETLPITGKNALCLAARIGTEVRAFIDAGCFAIGIDLNPGKENKFVVTGDFHALQFADSTVDIVFTNSFDHVFDKDRVVSEILRVLKNGGLFIIEIANQFGAYESLSWENENTLMEFFESKGFRLISTFRFDCPWHGIQAVFEYKKNS